MRLSQKEQQAICQAARQVFGPSSRVMVFGSRLDDQARGGDLDLLVECPQALDKPGLCIAHFAALIQMQIGLRKIDVLTVSPDHGLTPVHQIALQDGQWLS